MQYMHLMEEDGMAEYTTGDMARVAARRLLLAREDRPASAWVRGFTRGLVVGGGLGVLVGLCIAEDWWAVVYRGLELIAG